MHLLQISMDLQEVLLLHNDYSNDVFHCYGENLLEYHLEIYNRLGIRSFQSDDINIGWDGYFNG